MDRKFFGVLASAAGAAAPTSALLVGYINSGWLETFATETGDIYESLDVSSDVPSGNWATMSPDGSRLVIVDSNTTKEVIVYNSVPFSISSWTRRSTTYVNPDGSLGAAATLNITADSAYMIFPEANSSERNIVNQSINNGAGDVFPDIADPGVLWTPGGADMTQAGIVVVVKGQGDSTTNKLRKFTASTGAQISTGGGTGFGGILRLNPADDSMFVLRETGGIFIRAVSNYAVLEDLNIVDLSNTRDIAWSPDGNFLALITYTTSGGGAAEVFVWETTGWTLVLDGPFGVGDGMVFPSTVTGRRALAWSPDSAWLVAQNILFPNTFDSQLIIDQGNNRNVSIYNPFFKAPPGG